MQTAPTQHFGVLYKDKVTQENNPSEGDEEEFDEATKDTRACCLEHKSIMNKVRLNEDGDPIFYVSVIHSHPAGQFWISAETFLYLVDSFLEICQATYLACYLHCCNG